MVFPAPDGPSKVTISPFFYIKTYILYIIVVVWRKSCVHNIEKNLTYLFIIYFYFFKKYLDEIRIKIVAQKTRNKDGTDAASIRSCEAKSYALVEKVLKLKGLSIRVIGSSFIISSAKIKMYFLSKLASEF